MENIFEPNNTFNFAKLSLAQPIGIQGGAYFTKFLYNSQPFYIETPKCLSKQGFIKHGKKIYTELMFDNSDSQFINWIENLETNCHKLIYEHSDSWFKDKLELNDIESAFTASLRTYKSGKYYLLRVYGKINTLTNNPHIKIYNENETLLTTDDIKLDTNIISIIELLGIKFTNKSFQIEFEIKQMMVLTIDKLFENCIIKKHKNNQKNIQLAESKEEQLGEYDLEQLGELGELKQLEELGKLGELKDQKQEQKIEEQEQKIEEIEEQEIELEQDLGQEQDLVQKIQVLEEVYIEQNKLQTLGKEIIKEEQEQKENEKEKEKEKEQLDSNTLEEFDINDKLNSLETITLKKPNEVYYKIYKEARQKAKQIKRDAINAILEAKNIKNTYLIDSDSESDADSDFDEDSEIIDLDI